MTWALRVGGGDLSTPGFCLWETEGVFDANDVSLSWTTLHGRAGGVLTAAIEGVRTLTISGAHTTTAKTVAARVAAEDQFKDQVRAGLATLTRDDGVTAARQITGRLGRVSFKPIGHPLSHTDSRVTMTMQCVDAYWSAVEWSSRAIGATRATVELGTAPSTPIIRLMGAATTPIVTYRDAGGTAIKTLTTGISLAADEDWLDIDCRTGLVRLSDNLVVSNALATASNNMGDFPWALDPQDGDYPSSAWPTVEVNSGTGIVYWRKAYL